MKNAVTSHAGRFVSAILPLVALVVNLAMATTAMAQAPAQGVDTQFDVLGFIQEATLDQCGDSFCGGKIKINGHAIIVPSGTIVILPANALTWKEVFLQAPAPYTGVATGMALADLPKPLTTFEAHVIGNQVDGIFVAGLIDLSQQSPNTGGGLINFIDYAIGEMRVGGRLVRDGGGVPQNSLDPTQPGTRVRLNDPAGRFGRKMSLDQRLTLDADNPTVRSTTGFPMCLPRVDPAGQTADAACPQGNRPKDIAGNFVSNFTMPAPVVLAQGQLPDPRVMAPFEIGDFVTYSGTLVADSATQGSAGSAGTTYIAAHTAIANLAIYTSPGADPAYVAIDVGILGNGGVTVPANMEAVVRTRFEGFSTDPSRDIRLFGIDVAADGSTSDRQWGIVGVDPGPPRGTVKGRWRFRPPCTGVVATFQFCFGPLDENTFLPATREVRAVVDGAWTPNSTVRETNGLLAGQYHAPIAEYLFEESFPGTPQPPIKFATMPFLAQGGNSSSTGAIAGPLKPFPGTAGAPACLPPVADAGPNLTVASGAKNIPLAGAATGTAPLTYEWVAPPAFILLPSSAILAPTFTAPELASTNTFLFTLNVTGCNAQKSTKVISVTVTAATAPLPVVSPIAARTVLSGSRVSITAVGSGSHPLSYFWRQTSGIAQPFSAAVGSATMSFAHDLLPGKVTDDALKFTVIATDTVTLAASAAVTASVTVAPIPDIDTITVASYRISKQRLDITANSSVVSPGIVLALQPYRTTSGALFDPTTTGNVMLNGGGGVYTLSLVGVPQPAPASAPLTVRSNIGGTSPPTALTQLRN
jgi:hypothetical protein